MEAVPSTSELVGDNQIQATIEETATTAPRATKGIEKSSTDIGCATMAGKGKSVAKVAFAEDNGEIIEEFENQWHEDEWEEEPNLTKSGFEPLAASTPARRPQRLNKARSPFYGGDDIYDDPSMVLDHTFCPEDNGATESDNSVRSSEASDEDHLASPLLACSNAPTEPSTGETGKRKRKKPALPTSVPPLQGQSQTLDEPIIFSFKTLVNSVKVKAEHKFKAAEINTLPQLRACCLAPLGCKQSDLESVVDLAYRFFENKGWQPLTTESELASLLDELPTRRREEKKKGKELAAEKLTAPMKQPTGAGLKNVPVELLSGSQIETDWTAKLYARWFGACQKCGRDMFCVLGCVDEHGMSMLQIGAWAKALAAKFDDVSLDAPPKTVLFAAYWGAKVPLLDGAHPGTKSTAATKRSKASLLGSLGDGDIAAIVALVQAGFDTLKPKPAVADDTHLLDFMAAHDDLFPEIITFLCQLRDADSKRHEGRDWVIYSDKLTVVMGMRHMGELLLWDNSDADRIVQATGMPVGMVRYMLLKARVESKAIMSNHNTKSTTVTIDE
ncbi:hypothetical protein BKA62DRAFT_810525 [Auriculariales sp. MPI-PUGE-AT-0066]|nr:hypothetical protein BKA62DRAFT_810525 [Auriculariales sp. MPI-PUGE-AT-0066]